MEQSSVIDVISVLGFSPSLWTPERVKRAEHELRGEYDPNHMTEHLLAMNREFEKKKKDQAATGQVLANANIASNRSDVRFGANSFVPQT